MPPSLREWIDDDHLAWLVLDVVGEIDLREFYGAYRADGHGRAAHDPAMMVALLLYSYALGQRSSRAIERRCHEDVRRVSSAPTSSGSHDDRTVLPAELADRRSRHERLRRCREELEAEPEAGEGGEAVEIDLGTPEALGRHQRPGRVAGVGRREAGRQLGLARADGSLNGDQRLAQLPGQLPERLGGGGKRRGECAEVVSFGYIRSGARAYLAMASTCRPASAAVRATRSAGWAGFRGARAGGRRRRDRRRRRGQPDAELPEDLRPRVDGDIELRVVVGLASYPLVPESLETFLSTSWTVTPDANRVGYRFRGEPLAFVDREPPPGAGNDPSNVVDFGYPIGSIQVPVASSR